MIKDHASAPGINGFRWPSWTAFFVSASLLALEVSLTRVFSVVLWYHFGFMVVSLAMLSFAMAGAAVYRRTRASAIAPGTAGLFSLFASGILLPSVIGLTRVPVDPSLLADDLFQVILFGGIALITMVPFVLLGFALCAALEEGRSRINRVYGLSFLGGAVGVGLGLAGMEYLGGGGGILLAAAAAWIGGARLWKADFRRIAWTVAALAAAAASLALAPGIIPSESRKHFPALSPDQVIQREWNAFSSVVIYENPLRHGLWGMPPGYPGPLPEMLGIAIDEWAITSIVQNEEGPSEMSFFEAYPPTLGLETAPPGFRVLVVGAGGGLDVLGALYFGASKVAAVELNPLIVAAVKGPFREYSGDLYGDDRVEAHVEEGRHFVERSRQTFDRIILTGVDTFAATSAGAFALSENYIYTVEAFQAYLRRLAPDGVICMTRWFYEPPRQTLRLIAAAWQALVEEGIEDPGPCFFLARTGVRSLMLIKKEPFSETEIRAMLAGCADRNAQIVHAEGFHGDPVVDAFFTAEGRARLEADYPYRVDAPTDDSPFLFEHRRWSNLFRSEQDWFMDRLGGQEILFITLLALLACMGAGFLLIRLFLPVKGEGTGAAANRFTSRAGSAAGFFAIGAGYLGAEAVLLPKLALPLGHPVYAMSVVLVGLLVFSGLGALFSKKLPASRRWTALSCAAAALSIPLCFVGLYEVLAEGILLASLAGKILLSMALIAAPGFFLGIPFPLALRSFSREKPGFAAGAFLWNGVGSALAGPLAMASALTAGFNVTFWIAALLYLAAAAFWTAAE